MMRTRAELLTDLADAVRELTETRTLTEYRERVRVEPPSGRRKRQRRVRRREAHRVTLPGLLESLRVAAVPGSAEAGCATGGFESRPSAELEPLSVLREITDDVGRLARRFGIERGTLVGAVRGLVSLSTDDETLADIGRQAARWVRRARVATGIDPAPITLSEACVYCGRRNALVIAADLQAARCSRCGVEWDMNTIGLLAEMLTANQTRTTMPEVPCWMADCTRRGPHDQHQDHRGRAWRRDDRCIAG
jgi:hypothetical protein